MPVLHMSAVPTTRWTMSTPAIRRVQGLHGVASGISPAATETADGTRPTQSTQCPATRPEEGAGMEPRLSTSAPQDIHARARLWLRSRSIHAWLVVAALTAVWFSLAAGRPLSHPD